MKTYFLRFVSLLIVFLSVMEVALAQSFPPPMKTYPLQVKKSVMSGGKWVKIAVDKSGIYRLGDEELRKAGFSDPSKVGVYGYGGAGLPEDIRRIQDSDIPAIPILREGNAIYFYGQGTISWFYDEQAGFFRHSRNTYSNKGYYLLSDAQAPLMMSKASVPTGEPVSIDSYVMPLLHESELISLKQSGRRLFGEAFAFRTEQNFREHIPANVQGKALARLCFVGKFSSEATIKMSLGNTEVISARIPVPPEGRFPGYTAGYEKILIADKPAEVNGGDLPVMVSYSPQGHAAYLDYYELNMHAGFKLPAGQQMPIFIPYTNATAVRINIASRGSDLHLFNVSLYKGIMEVPCIRDGDHSRAILSGGKSGGEFAYVALDLKDAYTPTVIGAVNNQNLRGADTPDLIIITTDVLRPEAERLATYHRDADGLKVLVATQTEVFNEYTGGTPDATAYRLFAKTFYDRTNPQGGMSHMQLLLFGDGLYDNRKIAEELKAPDFQNTEYLLTYQSYNSLDVDSYVSDAYFTLLSNDDDKELTVGRRLNAIGIGRFSVRTPYEAAAAVDKTIRFSESREPGNWKMRAAFMADNGDGFSHASQSTSVADLLQGIYPEIMIDRILLDNYRRVTVNGQTTVPAAKRKLLDDLNSGILLLNYNGHGGPAGWGDEQIITYNSVKSLTNRFLPVWVTATCDFSNFDHPNTSAGEEVFLNRIGGSAALFTTARVVLDTYNAALNRGIVSALFSNIEEGRTVPLGSALSMARNVAVGDTVNKLQYLVLGDPAVRLKMPTRKIRISTINGAEASGTKTVPLRAMSRVELKGAVEMLDGSLDPQFSGKLFVTVFDSKQKHHLQNPDNDRTFDYSDYPSVIYAGVAEVKNGEFASSFVVPKDVIYADTNGRINLFAYDAGQRAEAAGVNTAIYIAGGSGSIDDPDSPPRINRLYMGDSTFRSGGEVNATPLFVADVFDRNGINHSGLGTGHNIQLAIDDREDLTFDLNSYYMPSSTDAGHGSVAFLLPSLPEGDHRARFTVWNVCNRPAIQDFTFRVVDGMMPTLSYVAVYPNPVRTETATFRVVTNQPGSDLQCQIEIFDFAGRCVMQSPPQPIRNDIGQPALVVLPIGNILPDGLYLYRVLVGTPGKSQASESHKLVIQRQ